ncbi:MAG: hypothetical protein LC105_05480 [Chitinophagales bacterium]|nr:hypothetical protein [Chitinophagales bacterium]
METYNSGYIKHRNRKIPIVWDGEHAEHIAQEHLNDKSTHPLLHIRIQQLAKLVKDWKSIKKGSKRLEGTIIDNLTNTKFLIIIENRSKFVLLITCYRK